MHVRESHSNANGDIEIDHYYESDSLFAMMEVLFYEFPEAEYIIQCRKFEEYSGDYKWIMVTGVRG